LDPVFALVIYEVARNEEGSGEKANYDDVFSLLLGK
jgi:hypothetical protein